MKTLNLSTLLFFMASLFMMTLPPAYSQINPVAGGNPPESNEEEEDECEEEDEDFVIVCKGGGGVLDSLDTLACISSEALTFDFSVFVRLNNLDKNPLPCDLVIGVEIDGGASGSLMIYSEPLVFTCSPTDICGCINTTTCVAESYFNIPVGFFDSVCAGSSGEVPVQINIGVFNECDSPTGPVYSPFIPNHTGCSGWFPSCMNIMNYGTFALDGCITCEGGMNQGFVSDEIVKAQSLNQIIESGQNSSSNNEVRLFPNPTNNILSIQGDNYSSISITEIIGIDGKNYSFKISSANSYDVSLLPSGLYIVVIQTENGSVAKRFMKN